MRIRLTVAYVGSQYGGWQVQPGRPTVQGALEQAVGNVTGSSVRVSGASRTDAGVHAAGQVCHFDPPKKLPPADWRRALNSMLPTDIRVVEAAVADDDFHARYGAQRKVYRYHLDTLPVASPFLAAFAWHCPGLRRLDELTSAAEHLVGPLDQRPFASQPEGDRPIRPVDACIVDADRLVTITFVGRSFLRHAVRGMVGALVEVGRGRLSGTDIASLAGGGERPASSAKAPPHGLCLASVHY